MLAGAGECFERHAALPWRNRTELNKTTQNQGIQRKSFTSLG
jgi:hypothetical protein